MIFFLQIFLILLFKKYKKKLLFHYKLNDFNFKFWLKEFESHLIKNIVIFLTNSLI